MGEQLSMANLPQVCAMDKLCVVVLRQVRHDKRSRLDKNIMLIGES